MRKIGTLTIAICLCCAPILLHAQEKGKQDKQKKVSVTEAGEIKLEALHLQAIIEKPSVTLVPKRVEPDLQEVEFIRRDFSRELKQLPKDLIENRLELKKIEKIRNLDDMLKRERGKVK